MGDEVGDGLPHRRIRDSLGACLERRVRLQRRYEVEGAGVAVHGERLEPRSAQNRYHHALELIARRLKHGAFVHQQRISELPELDHPHIVGGVC